MASVSDPPVLLSVGKVDNPESTVSPLTLNTIGEDDLVNPLIFPTEYLPTGAVMNPTALMPDVTVFESIQQVTKPTSPLLVKLAT